jgi:hypothetical protein
MKQSRGVALSLPGGGAPGNHIGDVGVTAIGEALKLNVALKSMNLFSES